jgi:hypothetical protein
MCEDDSRVVVLSPRFDNLFGFFQGRKPMEFRHSVGLPGRRRYADLMDDVGYRHAELRLLEYHYNLFDRKPLSLHGKPFFKANVCRKTNFAFVSDFLKQINLRPVGESKFEFNRLRKFSRQRSSLGMSSKTTAVEQPDKCDKNQLIECQFYQGLAARQPLFLCDLPYIQPQ